MPPQTLNQTASTGNVQLGRRRSTSLNIPQGAQGLLSGRPLVSSPANAVVSSGLTGIPNVSLRNQTAFNQITQVPQTTSAQRSAQISTSTAPPTPLAQTFTATTPAQTQQPFTQEQLARAQSILAARPTQQTSVVTPQSTARTRLEEAQEAFTATRIPTKQEIALQRQINQALEAEELGLQRIGEQTIPQGLLVGQQAALQRQAAIAAAPLQRQLALLQGQREAERQAAETELGFAREDIQAREADQQTIQDLALSAIQAGATQQQIQGILRSPDIASALTTAASTGLLRAPTELDTQVVSAGGRSQLINTQTGEVIRDLGATEGALGRAADAIATDLQREGVSPVTGKPFTENQSKAGAFASRIQEAEDALSGGRGFFVPFLPAFARSADRRQFEQAEKNFITAVLRRESGAAIAPSEFDDARDVYIPRATDDEATLQQKATARRIIFEALRNESAGAFDQVQQAIGVPVGETDEIDAFLDSI